MSKIKIRNKCIDCVYCSPPSVAINGNRIGSILYRCFKGVEFKDKQGTDTQAFDEYMEIKCLYFSRV